MNIAIITCRRYNDLANQMLAPNLQDSDLRRIGKEHAEIGRVVALADEKAKVERLISELETLEKEELSK